MSYVVVDAVLASTLPRPLRFLAVVLATYADDDGRRVRPGVARLARQLGTTPHSVQFGLRQLRALQVLAVESPVVIGPQGQAQPVGGRGGSTRYRFRLDVLAALPMVPERVKPASPFPAGIRAEKSEAHFAKGRSLLRKRVKPTSRKGEAGFTRSIRIRQDPSGSETGADAPAPPFKVDAAIAKKALAHSLETDRSEDFSNIAEWFKQLCAKQHHPYNSDTCTKAIQAVLKARNRSHRDRME